MSLPKYHKTLVHAHTALSALLSQLAALRKRPEIVSSINSAAEAIEADLKLAPTKAINAVEDMVLARTQLSTTASSLRKVATALESKRLDFSVYKTQLRKFGADSDQIKLFLDNSKTIVEQAASVTAPARQTGVISDEDFAVILSNHIRKGVDLSTPAAVGLLKPATAAYVRGLTNSELEVIARKHQFTGIIGTVLPARTQRQLLELVSHELMQRGDHKQASREQEDIARTADAIGKIKAIQAKYAPKLAALQVKQGSLALLQVPVRAQFVKTLREDTLESCGIKGKPFGYQQFTNNNYLLENQNLIVFRLSDAEAYNKETVLEARRNDGNIVQLNNLKRALRKAQAAAEELSAKPKPKGANDQLALRREVKEANARVESLEMQIAAVESSAEAAKKIIRTKAKIRKSTPNEIVGDYANHLLDLINQKSNVEHALVSGRMLHRIGNTDYVIMWTMPRHMLRKLLTLIGANGDFIKDWHLAWQ